MGFYALDFTSEFHPEREIYNFGVPFLRIVFSIKTRPLRQQNQYLNFHEGMSLVTVVSAVKQLKRQASLKMLQE